MKKFLVVLLIPIIFALWACTNLAINQTSSRFYDNMNESLPGFSNFNPSNPQQFSFSAMGDTHIGSDAGGNLMVRALQMSRNDGDGFALIAGDNTNTGIESELVTFVGQIANVGLPAYPAIGNHDIYFGGWHRYKRIVGKSIYSFNAGTVHIVVLDTANGTFGEDQLNWLANDLQRNTQPLKVVMTHFPIYIGEFSSVFKLSSDEEATIFKDMMNQYGVNLVISGHYHGYGDKTLGGTRYLVTGACNNILDIGNKAHYLKIMVQNGGITTRMISL